MDESERLKIGEDNLQTNYQEKSTCDEPETIRLEPNHNRQDISATDHYNQEEISNSTNMVQSSFPDSSGDLSTSKSEEQNNSSGNEQAKESNDPSSTNNLNASSLKVYDFNQLTRKFKPGNGCIYQSESVEGNSTKYTELSAITEMPPGLIFVTREEWGAIPPKRVGSKPNVTSVIVFTYATNSDTCDTPKKCEKVVRKLQRHHMRGGLPDIPYNFMVGGDGRVYEGRGWFANPRTLVQLTQLRGHLIEIAYLGDYRVERPNEAMFDAALELVDYGRQNFWIKERFGLFENYESVDITPVNIDM